MSALPSSPPAAHVHALRIYWEDTDAGGVVFYANYLKFFERARTEWLRAAGLGQQALADADGTIFIVSDARIRYIAPARLDDELQVSVSPIELGRARMVLAQQCRRGDTLLCEGTVTVACVDRLSFRPRRLPSDLLSRLGLNPLATPAA